MFTLFRQIKCMYVAVSILLTALAFLAVRGEEPGLKTRPSFNGATSWLNTQPLTLTKLRGKVILIDFWTYTCINWRRTLPYLREWAAKYKDQGLIVVGIHTPEFSFEYEVKNVTRALKEMNINYPIALDNNYEIWNSFQNQFWPALYLIDVKGNLRFQKFGEGDYEEAERQIQQLLKEASIKNVSDRPVILQPQGVEVSADWKNLKSTENFLSYNRTQGFASPEGILANKKKLYSIPES
jgi:thiol-disulfide isomerase/thioredoxin